MPTKNRRLEYRGGVDEAYARSVRNRAANNRERNIAESYFNSGADIGNLARAAYHFYRSVPWLGGEVEDPSTLRLTTGEAPTPGVRTPEDIAKTGLTIRRGAQIAKERGITEPIVEGYNRLKSFLSGPGYRTRLKNYYKAKGSSVVTQNMAPEQRIGEQLYNIETTKVHAPKGEIIDIDGSPMTTANGMYDPTTHTIQVKRSRLKADTPVHEMIHARNRGRAYLDNAKYRMRTKAEVQLNKELAEGNIMRNSPKANYLTDDAKYYGDVVEQEPRVLNTVAAMEREGYDINNLSDEQIYNYLYDRPIDTHGTDTQSLIDNYVMEDIPNAIRNFKNVAIPLLVGGTGYGTYRSLENRGGKSNRR